MHGTGSASCRKLCAGSAKAAQALFRYCVVCYNSFQDSRVCILREIAWYVLITAIGGASHFQQLEVKTHQFCLHLLFALMIMSILAFYTRPSAYFFVRFPCAQQQPCNGSCVNVKWRHHPEVNGPFFASLRALSIHGGGVLALGSALGFRLSTWSMWVSLYHNSFNNFSFD